MEPALNTTIEACLLVIVAGLLLVWRFGLGNRRTEHAPKKAWLPPGPRGFPLLGDLATLVGALSPSRAFAWSGTYGPVVRVKAGFSEIIILNDSDSMKTFLDHEDILYRSPNWIIGDKMDVGFTGYGGVAWNENRRFCLKLLRELGFGRAAMKDLLAEGCEHLLTRITNMREEPVDLLDLVLSSVCDNIGLFVFGRRYSFEHPDHCRLKGALREQFLASRDGSALSSLPSFATAVAKRLPRTRAATLSASMEALQAYVRHKLSGHITTIDCDEDRDFIDAYFRKSRCQERDATSGISSMSGLVGNALGILVAGSTTVAALLMRILLLVAANSDTLQARMQAEIDAAAGTERRPTWDDRHATPYTLAVIWEAHRWHTLLPLGLPRRVHRDAVVGGYFVPQGATVVANIWSVHNNPELWREPEKFDPLRFLKEDGSLAWDKMGRVMPFSVGKRKCPGEILASVEIYLYVTGILQNFRILPEAGIKVDVNINDKVIMKSGLYKFRCSPRTGIPPTNEVHERK